jgi:hypothetical protein
MSEATWRKLVIVLVATMSVIIGIFALFLLGRRRACLRDPVSRAYQRYCGKLRKMGLPREPFEGPIDYRRRIEARLPELRDAIARISMLYVALRYGREHDGPMLQELQQAVKRFPANPASARARRALGQ